VHIDHRIQFNIITLWFLVVLLYFLHTFEIKYIERKGRKMRHAIYNSVTKSKFVHLTASQRSTTATGDGVSKQWSLYFSSFFHFQLGSWRKDLYKTKSPNLNTQKILRELHTLYRNAKHRCSNYAITLLSQISSVISKHVFSMRQIVAVILQNCIMHCKFHLMHWVKKSV